MTIYKYPFPVLDYFELKMPRGARLLCVQMQGQQPCVWALVSPENAKETRRLRVFGTGHPVPENIGNYIGTFQMHGGELIFHVFEETS